MSQKAPAQKKITVDNVLKMCSELNTRSFATNYKKLLQLVKNPNNPPQIKLVIGEYLFRKVALMFRPTNSDTRALCSGLNAAVRETTNVVLRGSYLGYRNDAARGELCEAFFLARHDELYFILQMLNDQTLIKTTDPIAMKKHFLSWIERAPTLEQKSNLLDVLLRNFGEQDKEVKAVYDKLRFTDEKKDIYSDAQNAHNDIIQDGSIRNAGQLLEDMAIHLPEGENTIGAIGNALDAWYNLNNAAVKEVYERIQIDHTAFSFGPQIFRIIEVLRAAILYISLAESELAASLKVRLYEEIQEMSQLCTSGYIIHIMNIFRGFVEKYECNMGFDEQLYAVLINQLTARMNSPGFSEEIIFGTYDYDYRQAYVDYVLEVAKECYETWCADYGRADVRATIVPVLERALENKKVVCSWQGDQLASLAAREIVA